VLSACAGTPEAFSARYGDNDESELATLIDRLGNAPAKRQAAVAVGVSSEGSQLFGYDLLERKVLWKQPAKPRFTPLIAGESVVTQEGDRIIARDLHNGRLRFSIASEGQTLVGADGSGSAVLFTLTTGQGTFAKSRVLLMMDGTKRWSRDIAAPVGVPALVGEVALVPWSMQYLSGLSAADGDEFARLRVRDGVISQAFSSGGHVYAGSNSGIGALTSEVAMGSLSKGPHYVPPKDELPGRPAFLRDAYAANALPTPESAQNRIRLVYRPTVTGANQITLDSGNLYLVFYRFLFALDQKDLALRWVYAHGQDLVGASAVDGGVVLADMRGEVLLLAGQSGRVVFREQNALPSSTVEFPSQVSGLGPSRGDGPPSQVEVRQQLTAAAQDPDSRLVPMRLLAVRLLAALDDPEATASLLGLCDDEQTTIAVRKAACNTLPDRKLGTEFILQALKRHASYLEGTSSPPVGALAKAAAAQQVKPAVPLLIDHLRDPSTPAQTLGAVVTALGDLGDPTAIQPLRDFLRMYHADPLDEHVSRALEVAPAALVKLQGAAARDTLKEIVNDDLSAELARAQAAKALAQLDEQEKAVEKDPEAAQLAETQAAEQAAAAANKPPPPPQHITADIVAKSLLPVRDKIQDCIKGVQPDLFQARVVVVIEDGQALMVSVVPEQLQRCIEPLVRSANYPLTQLSQRDKINYTIKRF
jgi:HEAT repeat protein/outer membrane protein assembly factor BamB